MEAAGGDRTGVCVSCRGSIAASQQFDPPPPHFHGSTEWVSAEAGGRNMHSSCLVLGISAVRRKRQPAECQANERPHAASLIEI